MSDEKKEIRIATFDIEAENFVRPFLVGFYDGEDFFYFEGENCVKRFCEFILGKKNKYSKYRIYAHAGGSYDFLFLIEQFSEMGLKMNILIQNSSVFYFSVERGKKYLKFYDSYHLLPLNLEELTKAFNVEYKKINLDRSKIYEIYRKDRPLVIKYLKHDCIGLYQVLRKFYEIIYELGGEVRRTLSSTSFNLFKKKLEDQNIKIATVDNERWRSYYYGGRVEVFIRHGYNLFYYDFNSLYPYVMAKYSYPIDVPVKEDPNKFEDYEAGFVTIKVKVSIPEDHYPAPLPVRINEKLIFPVGEFITTVPLPEFKYALNTGFVEDYYIYELYVFNDVEPIFKDFIKELYERRLEAKKTGNKALDLIFKLLMNSCYGKFGEKNIKERLKKISEDEHDLLYQYPLYLEKAGIVKINENVKLRHVHLGIASHITCYARIELLDLMLKILKKGGVVYYCDTDSVVTNIKLSTGNKLGELKLEYEIFEGVFYGPKLYALKLKSGEEVVKAKGFPKALVSFNDIKKAVFEGYKFSTTFEKFGRLKESIKRFNQFYSMIQMEKRLLSDYDKRIIIDKIYTKPIKLEIS